MSRIITGGFPALQQTMFACLQVANDSRNAQQLQYDGCESATNDHRYHDNHQSGGEDELPLTGLCVPALGEGREGGGRREGERI